jgi:hypothetical protein
MTEFQSSLCKCSLIDNNKHTDWKWMLINYFYYRAYFHSLPKISVLSFLTLFTQFSVLASYGRLLAQIYRWYCPASLPFPLYPSVFQSGHFYQPLKWACICLSWKTLSTFKSWFIRNSPDPVASRISRWLIPGHVICLCWSSNEQLTA